MPIIEPITDQSEPLTQGDILKGVRLFSTKGAAGLNGGEPGMTNDSLSMVVSRPCTAANEELIVVAAIEQYKVRPPSEFDSFEDAIEFFTIMRDGKMAPNQFYLGQVPTYEGLFCARLDYLHTIQIPKAGGPERGAFIAAKRLAGLEVSFAHDLHLRLFRAYASLGFDDHAWYSTKDLEAIVAIGDRDVSKLTAQKSEFEAKLRMGSSQGFHHENDRKKQERERDALIAKIDKLSGEIAPYKSELQNRMKVT